MGRELRVGGYEERDTGAQRKMKPASAEQTPSAHPEPEARGAKA